MKELNLKSFLQEEKIGLMTKEVVSMRAIAPPEWQECE